jgi:hypothetical protein
MYYCDKGLDGKTDVVCYVGLGFAKCRLIESVLKIGLSEVFLPAR